MKQEMEENVTFWNRRYQISNSDNCCYVVLKTQFQYSEKYLCGRVTKNLTPHRMH